MKFVRICFELAIVYFLVGSIRDFFWRLPYLYPYSQGKFDSYAQTFIFIAIAFLLIAKEDRQ